MIGEMVAEPFSIPSVMIISLRDKFIRPVKGRSGLYWPSRIPEDPPLGPDSHNNGLQHKTTQFGSDFEALFLLLDLIGDNNKDAIKNGRAHVLYGWKVAQYVWWAQGTLS